MLLCCSVVYRTVCVSCTMDCTVVESRNGHWEDSDVPVRCQSWQLRTRDSTQTVESTMRILQCVVCLWWPDSRIHPCSSQTTNHASSSYISRTKSFHGCERLLWKDRSDSDSHNHHLLFISIISKLCGWIWSPFISLLTIATTTLSTTIAKALISLDHTNRFLWLFATVVFAPLFIACCLSFSLVCC